jgi:hypothetical protein
MTLPSKVIDCKASDNEYLHKDFHGALCYSIKYLDDTHGEEATEEYLRQVARTYYAPLSAAIRKDGLQALEKHWRSIFELEGGDVDIRWEDEVLLVEVRECPAVAHLKKRDMLFTTRFCQTTVVVNETVCQAGGVACSCDYEPGAGRCLQRFWRTDQ